MRGIGDVLQLVLSHIDELGGDRSSRMTPGIGGDADAAGRGEAFETRGEVDAVAIDVVRRNDNVTEIDAHPELHPPSFRQSGISRTHRALHFQGAADRVDDARELDKSAVSSVLDDPTAM